ncbi:MAG: NUDIX hydrolase [Bacilli bacterium]|nr:NUDIX hydrolase [Bacilli bacterium]
MRKEKIEELRSYIEELKTKKLELLDKKSKFLKVERYNCDLNNGQSIIREKLLKGNGNGTAVNILPITIGNTVILTVQPRVFTESTIGIDFPAGYVEPGEEYEKAALRELQEETGYFSKDLREVVKYYQDDGVSAAFNKGYVALDCVKISGQNLDPGEFIRYFECNIDELFELYEKGYIQGGGSQLLIEKSKEYLKGRR